MRTKIQLCASGQYVPQSVTPTLPRAASNFLGEAHVTGGNGMAGYLLQRSRA